jgi:ABC-2 type transport system ATP-binding protein
MKKRLALAIALLHKPQILILDEPTSGLDPRGVKALRSVLRDLNEKGLTILLSSHVLSEVQEICTHVGIINDGKLIRQESIQKIKEKVRKTAIKLSLRVKNYDKENNNEITKKKGISIIEVNDLGKHQQIILTLKEKQIPWVTNKLVSEGVQIFSIEPQDTSLEDVFMTETGGDSND